MGLANVILHFCVVYQLWVKDTLLQFLRVVDVVGDGLNRNRKINPLKIAFTTNCVTVGGKLSTQSSKYSIVLWTALAISE